MCGLSGYFARESVPGRKAIENLLKFGETRGTDGIGYCSIGKENNIFNIMDIVRIAGATDAEKISKDIVTDMRVGDLFVCNHRAATETEPPVADPKLSLQPIIDEKNGLILVHNGSVSKFIYDELRKYYQPNSKIDSEAIIWAYLKCGFNIKRTMEYLCGGFAFLLIDMNKEKLYAVATHNPLFCGYVKGHGLFFSSFMEAIYSTISILKGVKINRQNISIWEDYYAREIPSNTATEIDLDSGMINEFKFMPRYVHPNWDPISISQKTNKVTKVLVSCSGGLDSTTTLAVLKSSGYDVDAIHFKYGHRGQDAEQLAIEKITEILDVNLTTFDIQQNMSLLDKWSMLTDKKHPITTGTEEGLKTTSAWVCMRNSIFLTYIAALAEKLIIHNGYGRIFLTGGFLNLTESGVYPDNSERFVDAFSKFVEFGSIAGTRINILYACANLLKTDQYILLDKLGYLKKLGPWLISCDRPIVMNNKPYNCSKNGKPACGSGLLSYWACKMAGVKDRRRYYKIDEEYIAFEPDSDLSKKDIDLKDVLKKLRLHPINLRILHRKLMT